MDWKERLEHNKQVLDTLPIKNHMYPWQDVNELMYVLQTAYEQITLDDEVLQGDLFSEYDTQDFGLYLEERYKIPVHENINYQIGWYKKDGIN